MIKRHENELLHRLDKLWRCDVVTISEAELRQWFNKERISKTPYREILTSWESMLDEYELQYKDFPIKMWFNDITNEYILICCHKREIRDLKDSWAK